MNNPTEMLQHGLQGDIVSVTVTVLAAVWMLTLFFLPLMVWSANSHLRAIRKKVHETNEILEETNKILMATHQRIKAREQRDELPLLSQR